MNASRFLVVEGPPGAAFQTGAQLRHVCDLAGAAEVVLEAVGGGDLVITTDAPRDVIDRLVDDLRRIGTVEHRLRPAETLSPEQRQLLGRLLAGETLGDTARLLHLSRRTADRRLAAARLALGAATTAEALRRAAELGIMPFGPT